MTELLYTIFYMSLSASVLVMMVLILRLIFRKAPKWVNILLWGLVTVRLICPFTIESPLSLMPEMDWVRESVHTTELRVPDNLSTVSDSVPDENILYTPNDPEITIETINDYVVSILYFLGIMGMVAYMAFSYINVYRCICTAERLGSNIYRSKAIPSPFVFGLLQPRIYLPDGLDESAMSCVIAHEQVHIYRKDHWWTAFGFLLLTVYWFNPFFWLSYNLFCRDVEMACDERVVRDMSMEERAVYSQALLECSGNRRSISVYPLAFGEISVKTRIKAVLNYRKPAFWSVVLAVFVCIATAACFLTNPITGNDTDSLADDSFFVLIESEKIVEIEIFTPNNSGGCINADHSAFTVGEKVWLESLEHTKDLRGMSVNALNEEGEPVLSVSFSADASNEEILALLQTNSWLIVPERVLNELMQTSSLQKQNAVLETVTDDFVLVMEYANDITVSAAEAMFGSVGSSGIQTLEQISPGTVGLTEDILLYRLEYWITEGINSLEKTNPADIILGEVYFAMLYDRTVETWTRLGVLLR